MNIAFVTTYNAKNIVNWSGLGYYISKSLEDSGNKLQYIGDLRQITTPFNFLKKIFYSRILHQQYPIDRTVAAATSYSKEILKNLMVQSPDVIFSLGTIPVAYLDSDVPKIIYTDATFASMLGYYKSFSDLSAETIRLGHEMEQKALNACTLAIFASEWAANSAVNDYGIDPSKVKVVPFGANICVDYTQQDILKFIRQRGRLLLKILFNGRDWDRKGGDLVLKTVEALIKRGLEVELHVVGVKQLPFKELPSYVIDHGFLNKQVQAESSELTELYKSCHFLFLPSEAEAFGIVFSEASAYGMPSISKATGGITTAIINGKNGYALDPQAGVNDYADLISAIFSDYERYTQLALSSYKEYTTRLNWKTAGKELVNLMSEI